MIFLALLSVVILIAVNAVFVATEFSLVASRPVRLNKAAEQGSRLARLALEARSDLRRQMSGAQLGITLSSVALGVLAEPAIGPIVSLVLDPIGIAEGTIKTVSWLVAIGLATTLQMLFGELVPKNIAIAEPETTLYRVLGIHRIFVTFFAPAIWVLDKLASIAVKPFGYRPVDEIDHALGAAELSAVLVASRKEGLIERFEHDLLASALDLGIRSVDSLMLPREAIISVNRKMTLAEIEQVVVASGHSRLPVVGAGLDDILGFLHVKDLLRLPPEAQNEPVPLELIRRMLVVSPELPLDDLLVKMKRVRSHLSVVRRSDGSTLGIVSMEDIIEELIGDIRDESDISNM